MSKQDENRTDIVMITWERPKITIKAIDSIWSNTIWSPIRLMVVDNGSNNDLQDELRHFHRHGNIDTLLLLDDNYGLEYAKNRGLGLVNSKYFISTDNDILPMYPDEQGDWLSKLIKLMDDNPEYGAISCRTQIMIGSGNIFDGHEDEEIVEFPHPGGSLRIMRTDLVKKLGGWRDDEPLRGSEERYICGKIREAGYKTGFATKIKCWHLFSDDQNWGYGEIPPEEHGHRSEIKDSLPKDSEEEIAKWLTP